MRVFEIPMFYVYSRMIGNKDSPEKMFDHERLGGSIHDSFRHPTDEWMNQWMFTMVRPYK